MKVLLLVVLLTASVAAQGVRSRTRPAPSGTTVSDAQASDVTLTLTAVAIRPIQVWIRTAGTPDATHQVVTVDLPANEGRYVAVGQRARAFATETRSSMVQAFVSRVDADGDRVRVDLRLASRGRETAKRYVVEIVTDRGDLLSIPNEAIIEEGDSRVAYVRRDGRYWPQPIGTGLQGELYTQITSGLKDGDEVVTFGSFFIDAEFKLKGSGGAVVAPASP